MCHHDEVKECQRLEHAGDDIVHPLSNSWSRGSVSVSDPADFVTK